MTTPVDICFDGRTVRGRLLLFFAALIFAPAVGGHGLCLVVAEELGVKERRPNIVFILADDK